MSHNDKETLLKWLRMVILKSKLHHNNKKAAITYCEFRITKSGWLRGDVSEWLRDEFGRDKFMDCEMYY